MFSNFLMLKLVQSPRVEDVYMSVNVSCPSAKQLLLLLHPQAPAEISINRNMSQIKSNQHFEMCLKVFWNK